MNDDFLILKQAIPFWDLSLFPTSNDRVAKAGTYIGAMGAAVIERSEDGRAIYIDGETRGRFPTRRFLEPDNWVIRPHDPNGDGPDTTWDIRLIADHENEHARRGHRNTYVINQCLDQCQGVLADALWVKRVPPNGAEIFDRELFFNGAGFLEDLFLEPGSTPTPGGARRYRSAVMFNISQRGGYATDGRLAGQFKQVFTLARPQAGAGPMSPPTAPAAGGGPAPTLAGGFLPIPRSPTLPAGGQGYQGGQTQAEDGGGSSGPTQAEPGHPAGDCCGTEAGTLALRGDVRYDLPSGLACLDINEQQYEETHGDVFVGGLWPARQRAQGQGGGFGRTGNPTVRPGAAFGQNQGTPAGGSGGSGGVADDPSSNQPPLPDVPNARWIRPWIRVEPRFELVHEAAPWPPGGGPPGTPPSLDPPPTPVDTYAPISGAAAKAYSSSVEMGFVLSLDLPPNIAAGKRYNFVLNYEIPDFSGTIARFDLRYAVAAKGKAFTTTGTVTKHLTSADGDVDGVGRVVFTVPHSALSGMGGGKLYVDLMRRADDADDTYADRIYALQFASHFGDAIA